MKRAFLIASIGLSVLLAGCATSGKTSLTYTKDEVTSKSRFFDNEEKEVVYIDYKALAKEASATILSGIEIPKKLIVTDFVDVTSLENKSKLGYVLSNNMKNALINNHHAEIIEVEVSKYFKISGNGVKILSRDINKLLSINFDVRFAVVGTYTYTDKELIVFIKLIDLKTGIIKGSYAGTFPMGRGTKMMLEEK